VIARLATAQHGVVSRVQLLAAGVGRRAVVRRIESGRLHPIHRGVYLVGHAARPPHAREAAAVLACAPKAVVSHRSAARLWNLLPYPANAEVCITVVRSRAPSRPGLRIHRTGSLAGCDVARFQGIPITSPARTVLDLAAQANLRELEQAVGEAGTRRLATRAALADQLERNPGRRGTAALRAVLTIEAGPAYTRSEAERRMLALIRAATLPAPETNARLHRFQVDFLWRRQRLVLEVDGYAFHSDPAAFERDRRRDAELAARGYTVIRVTWRQIVRERDAVIARLAGALAAAELG
jgi:very-short-patch-repair endonuclease/predicted transcriptional regulator of viral defense system